MFCRCYSMMYNLSPQILFNYHKSYNQQIELLKQTISTFFRSIFFMPIGRSDYSFQQDQKGFAIFSFRPQARPKLNKHSTFFDDGHNRRESELSRSLKEVLDVCRVSLPGTGVSFLTIKLLMRGSYKHSEVVVIQLCHSYARCEEDQKR